MTGTLQPATIEALETAARGDVVGPEDDRYDDARAVWNGMIDRRPGAIVECTGVADVIETVRIAREADRHVAVRGGGHNVSGSAVCDDGIVVDLSAMDAVSVDLEAKTARVGGGATWADVDHETQAFGLAAPGGVVSKTGVGGLTLGGGIGHLCRKYGLSCDNLRTVEVVTANGEFLRASEHKHADLFWALRGGATTPGVVTTFEFDLHEVGPDVATCLVFYHREDLLAVLETFREYSRTAPDEVSLLTFSGQLPDPELFAPEDVDESKIAVMGCHAGPPADGERELSKLRDIAPVIADFSATMPYAEFQQLLDEDYPDGMRYYWKSLFLDDLSPSAIDRIAYWTDAAPAPESTVDVWQLGGEIMRFDEETSAFAGRGAPFLLGVEANWHEAANDEENVAWVRDCLEDMRQFSDGSVYLNFPGFHEGGEETLRTTFGPAYDRLREVVDRYDPNGLFDRVGDRPE